jgi:hypothetical protein
MDNILQPLLERLPTPYLLPMVILILLAVLGLLIWGAKKNREVKLLWGAITLTPHTKGSDGEILRAVMASTEGVSSELMKLRADVLADRRRLLEDEAKLTDKLINPYTLPSVQQRLEKSIQRSRQDRQYLEQAIVGRLYEFEKQLERVGESLKEKTKRTNEPTSRST